MTPRRHGRAGGRDRAAAIALRRAAAHDAAGQGRADEAAAPGYRSTQADVDRRQAGAPDREGRAHEDAGRRGSGPASPALLARVAQDGRRRRAHRARPHGRAVSAWRIGINAFARWNARRLAAQTRARWRIAPRTTCSSSAWTTARRSGFAALKAERPNKRVLGIAIPDGAFVEVPGQGFERIGESYVAGPEVAKDAVSNYLLVPFLRYVVVDGDAYQGLLKSQDVAQLLAARGPDRPDEGRAGELPAVLLVGQDRRTSGSSRCPSNRSRSAISATSSPSGRRSPTSCCSGGA